MSEIDSIAKIIGNSSRRKPSGGWLVRCPCHNDGSPSLSLDVGNNGVLLVKCFAGCDSTIVLKELRKILGTDYKAPDNKVIKPTWQTTVKEWSYHAQSIWNQRKDLSGSLGEVYLLARSCIIPDSDDIGFLPDYKGHPALMARVTCPLSNKPFTLHFTSLTPDGRAKADIDRPKDVLFGHRLKGGVIRLSRDEDVTGGLGIAEGIETALNCQFLPIWATVNADNMSVFPVLAGIESLTIFADHDIAGIKAAEKCAIRWKNANHEARIIVPATPKTDFADRI